MKPARTIQDGPFCWQNKLARRTIRDAFDATNNVATALAVYDALTEIASDAQAEAFKTTHAWIQRLSGVGVTTIKKHLSAFSDLGLVEIKTPALRAPSSYTLLGIGNGWLAIADGCPALANTTQSAPLATSEERLKNVFKEGRSPDPAGAVRVGRSSPFNPPTPDEVTQYTAEIGYPMDGAAWCDSYAQKGWMVGKSKMKDWKAAARNWKRNGWQPSATSRPTAPEATVRRVDISQQ